MDYAVADNATLNRGDILTWIPVEATNGDGLINASFPNGTWEWSPRLVLTPAALATLAVLVITAFGNILVCMAIVYERRLQNMTNYFLMSLAITDLMVAVLVMPLGIITINEGYFPLPSIYCLMWVLLDVLFCTCSIMHLCTISVDRFLSLRYPIKFGRIKTKRRVVLKICLVWVLSGAMSLPLALLYAKDEHAVLRNGACYIQDPLFVTVGSIVCFYIPLIIMFTTYALTVRLLKQKEREFRASKTGPNESTHILDPKTSAKPRSKRSFFNRQLSSSSWRRFLSKTYSVSSSTTCDADASCTDPAGPCYHPDLYRTSSDASTHYSSGQYDGYASNPGQAHSQSTRQQSFELLPLAGIAVASSGVRYNIASLTSSPTSSPSTTSSPLIRLQASEKNSSELLPPPLTQSSVMPARKEVHAIRKYSVKYRPPLRRLDLSQQIKSTEKDISPEDLWLQVHADPLTGMKTNVTLVSSGMMSSLQERKNGNGSTPSTPSESSEGLGNGSITAMAARNVVMVLNANGGTGGFQSIVTDGSTNSPVLTATQEPRAKTTPFKQAEQNGLSLSPTVNETKTTTEDVAIEPDSFSTTTTTTTSQSFRDPAGSVGSRYGASTAVGGVGIGGEAFSSTLFSPFLRSNSNRSTVSQTTSIRKSTSRHGSGGRFIRAEQKASKVLGIIFFTFVVMWTPFFLLNLISVCRSGVAGGDIDPTIQDTALWLGYASSTVNPIFYTVFNKTFRQTFGRILWCRWQKIRRN